MAQQHFHKSLPPTLFLCSETFSLACCFVNICCLKQEHVSRVPAHVTESLGKGYSDAAELHTEYDRNTYADLIEHVTHAVYLDSKYTGKLSSLKIVYYIYYIYCILTLCFGSLVLSKRQAVHED